MIPSDLSNLANISNKTASSVGHMVEAAVRQWLGCHVKLDCNRILTWREHSGTGKVRYYAEIDAVHRIDYDTVVVFEIKFTTRESMLGKRGRSQLDRTQRLLQTSPTARRVLKRLVYVGDGSLAIPGMRPVDVMDMAYDNGVIWVAPEIVEATSLDRGVKMPADWLSPHRHHVESEQTRSEPVSPQPSTVAMNSTRGIGSFAGSTVNTAGQSALVSMTLAMAS